MSLKKFFTLSMLLSQTQAFAQTKEWTMLVFLNGKNNLDSYGYDDINEMEEVGSTATRNIVVQWGSLSRPDVKRLYIQKDSEPYQVTSPVVENLGPTDMGSWVNLKNFIEWGAKTYPAKKYFVVVWNHGSGWRFQQLRKQGFANQLIPTDISSDDKTGNVITTEQLGRALTESAETIGHKIDIYGSDACLMQMAEVNSEMRDAVSYVVGSQDLEPGMGWPYGDFFRAWDALGTTDTPKNVARVLTQAYGASYQGGSQGESQVTLSAVDMNELENFENAMRDLAQDLKRVGPSKSAEIFAIAQMTKNFYESDYVDLRDLLNGLSKNNLGISPDVINKVHENLNRYVYSNHHGQSYGDIGGLSIWFPANNFTFEDSFDRYSKFHFSKATQWTEMLRSLF